MDLEMGLKKLRTGALLAIVGDLVAIVGVALAFASMGMAMGMNSPQAALLFAGTLALPMLAAAVLGLIAFIFWFQATGYLKKVNSELGIGRTGMVLQIVGIAVMLLSMLLMAGSLAAARSGFNAMTGAMMGLLGFMFLGGFLILVGAILFGIMILRLAKVPEVDPGFQTAGIVYIVAIVSSLIPYVSVVGWILMFVALILIYSYAGRSLESLQ